MTLEKRFIAGCLQDPKVVDRAKRAKIQPHHLSDGVYRYIYRAVLDISRKEDVDAGVVKQWVMLDTNRDDHREVCSKVDQLSRVDLSGVELSIDVLEKYRLRADLVGALGEVLDKLDDDSVDPKGVLTQHEETISSIKSIEETYEIFDYYDDWGDRQVERVSLSEESGDTLKFIGNMSPFSKYLPRGQQRQEMTALAGPTYSGKSVLLTNILHMAAHPDNGFDCLYVFSENRKIQATSRLDAIFLGLDYDLLYEKGLHDPEGDKFFKAATKDGWGHIFMSRVTPGQFTSETFAGMIDFIKERYDIVIDALFVDSPEHQRPISSQGRWHLDKGQVWLDNKNLAEAKDLFFIGTTQMKASSTKGDNVSNEDLAGSYDISRHVDNIFAYNVDPGDRILNRAKIQVTKVRDGSTDNGINYFYFERSHRMRPWEEVFNGEISPDAPADTDTAFKIQQFKTEEEREGYSKIRSGGKTFNLHTRSRRGSKSEEDSES